MNFTLFFERKKAYVSITSLEERLAFFSQHTHKDSIMKYTIGVNLVVAIALIAGNAFGQTSTAPKTDKQKVSYTIGISLAKDFKARNIEVDPQMLYQGLKDELGGKKLALTEQEMEIVMQKFQQEMTAKMEKIQKEESVKNRQAGDTYLAQNKKKPGVITLADGLQYRIIKKGNGPKPTATQTVKVHYRGTFIDGKEFDSSYKRGEPAEFPVNGVIPGWSEALMLMPVGSKWEVVIPPDLAYGDNGAGAVIPPGSTLVFEVELLEVK